jgi:hypothetical protein
MVVQHDHDVVHERGDMCGDSRCKRCGCCQHCVDHWCPCDYGAEGCACYTPTDEEQEAQTVDEIFGEMMFFAALGGNNG